MSMALFLNFIRRSPVHEANLEIKGSFPIHSKPSNSFNAGAVLESLQFLRKHADKHRLGANAHLLADANPPAPDIIKEIQFLMGECQKSFKDMAPPGILERSYRVIESVLNEKSPGFLEQFPIYLESLHIFVGIKSPPQVEIKTHSFHRGSKKEGKVKEVSFRLIFVKLEKEIMKLPISVRQKNFGIIIARFIFLESTVTGRARDHKMMKVAWNLVWPIVQKWNLLREERANEHLKYKFKRFFEGSDERDEWL